MVLICHAMFYLEKGVHHQKMHILDNSRGDLSMMTGRMIVSLSRKKLSRDFAWLL